MIRTQQLTPRNYSKESRDFQLIANIYDIVYNHIKTNIDMIVPTITSNKGDKTLIDLTATTLGFFESDRFDNNLVQLLASGFKTILRKKGTKTGLEYCLNLLLKNEDSEKEYDLTITNINNDGEHLYKVTIRVPETINTLLLEYLLDYILPSGYIYSLYQGKLALATHKTIIKTTSKTELERYSAQELSTIKGSDKDLDGDDDIDNTYEYSNMLVASFNNTANS